MVSARVSRRPVAAIVALFVLVSCVDTTRWYPSGVAEIVDFREYDDFGTPVVSVTYRIRNTGASVILVSTVNISFETGERTYERTVVNTTRVLPAHSIAAVYELELSEPEESLESVTVTEVFFE